MSDISVTAANVQPGATAKLVDGTFGATVTAGQSVYFDTVTNTWKLFDANLSAAAAVLGGVAMCGGASGQPGKILVSGDYNPGATVAVGTVYVGSATAGGIAPAADLVTGWYTNVLGVATTTSNIRVNIQASGVAVP